jgi:hypothetical protein
MSRGGLVASASDEHLADIPVHPPQAWFSMEEMEEPEPFTVYADGRVYGLIAQWGTCHIGFKDRCISVPKGGAPFRHFRNKNTLSEDGDLIATGPIYMDTVHPDLKKKASDAQAFYAHTGCAVADVALYENEWGIVACGALRSSITAEQAQNLRRSDVSPDWRQIDGKLQIVGLLGVNVSGFIVEGLVASGGAPAVNTGAKGIYDSVSGEVRSLVAAGMVRREEFVTQAVHREEITELRAEIDDLREAIRPMRAERVAARFASLALASNDVSEGDTAEAVVESDEVTEEAVADCGCGVAAVEECACSVVS